MAKKMLKLRKKVGDNEAFLGKIDIWNLKVLETRSVASRATQLPSPPKF